MPLISLPHNLKTEVLSWPFPSRTVVPLEDNKTVVLLLTMHNTEEINADSEKEKLLLPVFTGLGYMPTSPDASFTLKF